ncbi:hypothetical protein DFW101_3310 [Solidesulfovibrio carbinoliphilus subsp. oakridgensis]|uniref:Uncharacterized protein n=1 Tax=Solidesulfovibrio carbinoliphilus subsp. oakridgensis TaxID=694327 RepID=G7QAS8_9BACT|nr:hypothetical protein DFW101_3310 [Solidesulfovibrio carbinoliphilus subsp. oakridgensis]
MIPSRTLPNGVGGSLGGNVGRRGIDVCWRNRAGDTGRKSGKPRRPDCANMVRRRRSAARKK